MNVSRRKSGNFLKKIKGKNQEDSQSDVLAIATGNANYEMMRLLASRADQSSLDSALPTALIMQDIIGARVLLERGANPGESHDEFLNIMTEGNKAMVELLLSGPFIPCFSCRTAAVIIATSAGSLHIASLLVQSQVDTNFQEAAALKIAIQNRRVDIALAIVISPCRPSPSSLDGAMCLLYELYGYDLGLTVSFAEILLCGGAAGDSVSAILVEATRNQQIQLIDLILHHKGSVDFQGGAAIQCVILARSLDVLTRLLISRPTKDTLSDAIMSTYKTILDDFTYSHKVISRLLCAGLKGAAVDEFFYWAVVLLCGAEGGQVVNSSSAVGHNLIRMLLRESHTDVNFNAAASMRTAAGSSNIDILQLMRAKSPSQSSLGRTLLEVMKTPEESSRRLDMTKMLLDAGVNGDPVHRALVLAVKEVKWNRELVTQLLNKASVDYNEGEALRVAISRKDLGQLQCLLSARPKTATLPAFGIRRSYSQISLSIRWCLSCYLRRMFLPLHYKTCLLPLS